MGQPELLSDLLASEERLCSQEVGYVPSIIVFVAWVDCRYSSDGASRIALNSKMSLGDNERPFHTNTQRSIAMLTQHV
jgi:hypothetical protein